MLVTTSDACRLLRDEAGVSRDWARVLLTAGAAGPGMRVGRSVLHDVDRVRLLAARPMLAPANLVDAAPTGLFVGRLGRERAPDLTATEAERRVAVSEPWPMQFRPRLVARVRAGDGRPMPFVATVAGFVVAVGDVRDVVAVAPGRFRLALGKPGTWYDRLREGRISLGRGQALRLWGFAPDLQARSTSSPSGV